MLRSSEKLLRVSDQLDPLAFQRRLPYPTFVGQGSGGVESLSAGTIGGRHASIATGDWEVVCIETNTGQPGTISDSGWAQLDASPQDPGSDTCLAVWVHKFTAGDPLPTINDSGDHQVAHIFAFSGIYSGVEASAGTTGAASTSWTAPSITTLSWNAMVLVAVGNGRDQLVTDADMGSANFNPWCVSDHITLRRVFGRVSTIGGGGGFGLYIGWKTEPGPTGTLAGAFASSQAFGVVTWAFR